MPDPEDVTLESLTGPHVLDAVDFGSVEIERYPESERFRRIESCNTISFRLDGNVYTAVEDPENGYRSSLGKLFVDQRPMQNVFIRVRVMGRMKQNTDQQSNETLELLDVMTGKVVLEVGTDNTSDYYPYFVASFMPENMVVNIGRQGTEG